MAKLSIDLGARNPHLSPKNWHPNLLCRKGMVFLPETNPLVAKPAPKPVLTPAHPRAVNLGNFAEVKPPTFEDKPIGFEDSNTITFHTGGMRFVFHLHTVKKTFELHALYFKEGEAQASQRALTDFEKTKFGNAAIHLKQAKGNKSQRGTKDMLFKALDYEALKAKEEYLSQLIKMLSKRKIAFGEAFIRSVEVLLKVNEDFVIIMTLNERSLGCYNHESEKLFVLCIGENAIIEREMSKEEKAAMRKAAEEKLYGQTHCQRVTLEGLKKTLLEPS
jgi:hypothetical protein